MLSQDDISHYSRYVEELRLLVDGLKVPANDRVRCAGSCFAIAQEHHHAIVMLMEYRLYAAAFALIRCEFEAYIRGEWLSQCASDSLVVAFLKGKEPPKLACMLEQLEMLQAFNEGILSRIKQTSWTAMCGYAHTGGLHVQRWNSESGIEANYSKDEVIEVLRFAEMLASLAVLGLATLATDERLAL